MALIRHVANCDFNHNFEHGNATTAKMSLSMFCQCVAKHVVKQE